MAITVCDHHRNGFVITMLALILSMIQAIGVRPQRLALKPFPNILCECSKLTNEIDMFDSKSKFVCIHTFLDLHTQQTKSNADFSHVSTAVTINSLTICRIIALSPDFNRNKICYIFGVKNGPKKTAIVSKMQQSI